MNRRRAPALSPAAVQAELPSARWQRCLAHFQRNVLCHVPAQDMAQVAADLCEIFAVHRQESAQALAETFVARHGKRLGKAVSVLQSGLDNALTFLAFPSSHHRLLRTTNGLERLFGEVKRRTQVVGVFPGEKSAAISAPLSCCGRPKNGHSSDIWTWNH